MKSFIHIRTFTAKFGLSETGRKNLKMQFVMTASAVAVLATNAVFK